MAGSFTVEGDRGFRFARDTQIALAADGESILLSVGGLTIDMGPSMTLTRQAVTDGGENGLYIHETGRNTLYEGDLSVSLADGGLRCILRIHIEDYLKGVVAYEMSDSFPLEALKAQAVAARTYAMGRKWVSAARDYDVVDTTQDQVYRGWTAIRSTSSRRWRPRAAWWALTTAASPCVTTPPATAARRRWPRTSGAVPGITAIWP